MKSFPFVLLTVSGVAYEGDAIEAYLPSEAGPLGILPGHTPIAGVIKKDGGILRLKDESAKSLFFLLRGGAFKVLKEKTIVLSPSAVSFSTMEEAEKALEEWKKSAKSLPKGNK